MFDKLVKSQKAPVFVISAKAGILETQPLVDSRFRGNDALGTFCETIMFGVGIKYFRQSMAIVLLCPLQPSV